MRDQEENGTHGKQVTKGQYSEGCNRLVGRPRLTFVLTAVYTGVG